MKFTYNWLKEFVDIRHGPEELAHLLTMAGIEVSSVRSQAGDTVFEAEITSNRPDWLSVRGIAREVAALTGRRMKAKNPARSRKQRSKARASFAITIDNKKDCPLYTAAIIENVSVGPSPAWLKKRLELIGCRSVNNLVDITNYIMFEYGEPLHAFDKALLAGEAIRVRRARQAERFISIDGVERALSPEILVIADKHKPVALAGIMGGKESEVGPATTGILLEAAVFNPALVRKARQRLGLGSESSYRFERGVDPDAVEEARDAAALMITQICAGALAGVSKSGTLSGRARKITVNIDRARKIIGAPVSEARVKRILGDLGFKIGARSRSALTVDIPSRRQDVSVEADLIEEIARIYGYERIPATFPAVKPTIAGTTHYDRVFSVKNILAGCGLNEAITYSLVSREVLDALTEVKPAAETIELENPLSREQAFLRPTLIPGLIQAVAHNFNQGEGYAALFEIAPVFYKHKGTVQEKLSLGIALAGTRPLLFEQGKVIDEMTPLHLKGVLAELARRVGIEALSYAADGSAGTYTINASGKPIGIVMRVPERVCQIYSLKNKPVFAAELFLDPLLDALKKERRFIPLPRYPGSARDISCVVADSISLDDLLKACREKGAPLLDEIAVTDYYRGEQIPQGHRGFTISCYYRRNERTLTESEVEPVHAGICALLKERFSATLR